MQDLVETQEFKVGWKVLLAAFYGVGISVISLSFYSLGLFVIPWEQEFGWSRAEINFSQTLNSLAIVVALPLAGKLIDQFGLRLVTCGSLVLYGVGTLSLSFMGGSLYTYYALILFYSVVAAASTPLSFTRAVNAWFVKSRGLANGICLSSTGLAAVLLPLLLAPLVSEYGWRAAHWVMAGLIFAAVPLCLLWLRDPEIPPLAHAAPDDFETQPAGIAPAASMTLREAAHAPVFWLMGSIFFCIALAVIGLIPSFIPLLQGAGVSAAKASVYAGMLGASVMAGRLVSGVLIDHFFAPRVMAATFTLVSLGIFLLAVGGIAYAPITAVALGFAVGSEVDMIGYLTVRYFGLSNYGAIYSIQYGVFLIGAGISPIIVAYIWDLTASYDNALFLCACLLVAVVVLSLTLPRFPDLSLAKDSS